MANLGLIEANKEDAYNYYAKNKNNIYDNNPWGVWRGGNKVGRIDIKQAEAGATAFNAFSDDLEAVEVYQKLSGRIQANNEATFQAEQGSIKEAYLTLAQYAPQGVDQAVYDMLPTILEYPAIVFDSISKQNPNAVCILSEKTTKSGLPVIVAINPDGKGRYNDVRIISNFVLSTYGRNNPIGYLNELSKNSGKVLYIDEFRTKKLLKVIYDKNKRTKEEFKGARLQLPAGLNNLRFNYILHKSENIVKSNVRENNGRIRLEDRINGEELLNAIDTIKEIRDIKQNLFITSEIKKQHGELGKQITEAKKTLQEAEGTATKLSEQLISILGIFAGIIVTFSFAITTIGEALANVTELNIKYLLLIVSILGVVFMNVISLLMSFVIKLSGRNIKTCIPWVVFGCTNLVLVALAVFFTLVM